MKKRKDKIGQEERGILDALIHFEMRADTLLREARHTRAFTGHNAREIARDYANGDQPLTEESRVRR